MVQLTDEFSLARQGLAKDIVSEIVLSENPEQVIKKWRIIFKISQKALANELGITSSVVSDYESGRRRSPGIRVIRKYVEALMDIDTKNSGHTIRGFVRTTESPPLSKAIMDIREFSRGVDIQEFCTKINAVPVTKAPLPKRDIYGYTIIDSIKAITELSFSELIKLYGITTQRALIFTQVSTGRSPMVAIKVTNMMPGLVVLHGLTNVDEIAKRIADAEQIPLAVSRLPGVEEIAGRLRQIEM